ncbi:MAG: hypothetical protein U1E14_12780 [Geminicoccaceae bacterium]
MNGYSIVWSPHLPWAVLAVLAAAALVLVAYGVVRRAKGAWLRLVFAALILGALANPVLQRELREPLSDTVVVAVDRSASQRLGERPQQTDAALAALRERLAGIPDLEVREITVDDRGGGGTRLFDSLRETLGGIDRERLAGVIALTDGQIADVPADNPLGAPLHVLLTGRPGENDRVLAVDQAPTFGMVGEPQSLTVRVDEQAGETPATAPVGVVLKQDGRIVARAEALPGQPATLPFTLDKAGTSVLEVEAETRDGELTPLNNRSALFVNGVRDRLRVLLVSGQPYPGLRVWRNLLKADPAVDLVHFTILRPPEKQDGTPIRELALIAFPSRELFEVKLNEFDLIIFDRYSRRGLLPLVYLDNIARYVEDGGALLEAAGPEFAEPTSLYRTPLARVLPGRPSGQVFERGYTPTLTELGNRHPVTSGLQEESGEEAWGRWFRQVDVEASDGGEVLMSGVADRPLLVLKRVGEGRVAQLLSDHAWLWARGFEGGGPQSLLLRRLVHWLMREPQLEEEQLTARPAGDGLVIERRSLKTEPATVTVTAPSGATQTVTLTPGADGLASTRVEVAEDGLYRATDGTLTAYAAPRPIAPAELNDMRATADRLQPVVAATGGAARWLADSGVPDIRRVQPDRTAAGRGWIGLRANEAFRVTGSLQLPLLPAWLALGLMLATAALAWWREGKS